VQEIGSSFQIARLDLATGKAIRRLFSQLLEFEEQRREPIEQVLIAINALYDEGQYPPLFPFLFEPLRLAIGVGLRVGLRAGLGIFRYIGVCGEGLGALLGALLGCDGCGRSNLGCDRYRRCLGCVRYRRRCSGRLPPALGDASALVGAAFFKALLTATDRQQFVDARPAEVGAVFFFKHLEAGAPALGPCLVEQLGNCVPVVLSFLEFNAGLFPGGHLVGLNLLQPSGNFLAKVGKGAAFDLPVVEFSRRHREPSTVGSERAARSA